VHEDFHTTTYWTFVRYDQGDVRPLRVDERDALGRMVSRVRVDDRQVDRLYDVIGRYVT
jgi:hypothetical protein